MDKDEIEAEQDEKRQRKRQNKEFQSFSKKIADLVRILFFKIIIIIIINDYSIFNRVMD